MVKKPFLPPRYPSDMSRNKPSPYFNPFTLRGLGLDEGKMKEAGYTEAGPWNWQWHQNVFDLLPENASKFRDAAYRLQPEAELDFSPFSKLMSATAEVDAAVARIHDLGASPNTHAQSGYRKNCAAVIGQWELLYACFETKPGNCPPLSGSLDHTVKNGLLCAKPDAFSPPLQVEHTGDWGCSESPIRGADEQGDQGPNASSTVGVLPREHSSPGAIRSPSSTSRVSSSHSCISDMHDIPSLLEDCPDLCRWSSLSSISSSLDTQSPELFSPHLHTLYDELLEKDDPYGDIGKGEGIWMDGLEDFGNTYVAKTLLEDENDENRPGHGVSNLSVLDPLLIPPADLRANRSPLAILYEQEADIADSPPLAAMSVNIEVHQQHPSPKRHTLPPLRPVSTDELDRLERLHERAKCIDDWTWVFGDETTHICEEVVADIFAESDATL